MNIVKAECRSSQGIFVSRHCCRTGFYVVRIEIDGFIRSGSSAGKT